MKRSRQKVMGLDDGWKFMEQGIRKLERILETRQRRTQFSSKEYMNLYTTIYNLCTQIPPNNYSAQLYEKYKGAFDRYLLSKVLPSLQEKHDEFLLRELLYRWENHKIMVKWLSRFFSYLERFYTVQWKLLGLNDLGLTRFRDLVYEELKGKIGDTVVALIDHEREGGQIDRALLKNVLHIFLEIGLGKMDYYENDFEAYMLDDTKAYYLWKASNWIIEDSCPEYMIKAEECLRREKDRASHYLHSSSKAKLLEKAQNELLVTYGSQLLDKEHSGCRGLLRDGKVDDISRMYRLFSEVPNGLDIVATVFKQHVTDEGMALVQQAEEATKSKAETVGGSLEQGFVGKAIELHEKYMKLVLGSFSNSTPFHKAFREAFAVFCNKVVAGSPCAELLASYCDNVLKKGSSKTLSDEAIEESLDKATKLLDYISDKDLFAEFYRKKLSRRLLFDRSGNDDPGRLILTKLKQQNGGQFTFKMEGMLKDVTLSKEIQNEFQHYLNSNTNATAEIDLNVMVLTTGSWPSYKSSGLSLPSEMAKCIQAFKEFYMIKTVKRKLAFIYSLGTCNVNGKFESRTIELVLGTYQTAALLLFNDSERLSYGEIKAQLNLADDDLVRVLQSLSCLKYKILRKEPNTKDVSKTDVFEFNSKFTDRMRRIRVPLPTVDDRKKVVEDVDKERRYAIDAAVVRIMKSRKVLSHQELVQECVEQLKRMFKPDIKAIKKRIEELISRDYLERDKENPTLYKYCT